MNLSSTSIISLETGSYIVRIYNRYSSDSVSVYSPVFETSKILSNLTNDIYSEKGVTYYNLTMPSSGNIDFNVNYENSVVTIYDTRLNLLNQIDSTLVLSLKAGSYIVKIYNEDSSDRVTVYSPIFETSNTLSNLTNTINNNWSGNLNSYSEIKQF